MHSSAVHGGGGGGGGGGRSCDGSGGSADCSGSDDNGRDLTVLEWSAGSDEGRASGLVRRKTIVRAGVESRRTKNSSTTTRSNAATTDLWVPPAMTQTRDGEKQRTQSIFSPVCWIDR